VTLFDGLYSYEIVLLVLWVALFLALTVSLVFLIAENRPVAKLFVFFVIPVVMIGYPSIKSIQFSDGIYQVEIDTKTLEHDPANQSMRAELAGTVSTLAARPSSSPATLATIARAQIVLGENKQAQATLQKALQVAPKNPQVLAVKQPLELPQELGPLGTQVKQGTTKGH
jgi:cytochrome c-type biogenesis protein CcmH/NrfG